MRGPVGGRSSPELPWLGSSRVMRSEIRRETGGQAVLERDDLSLHSYLGEGEFLGGQRDSQMRNL